jgi:hypothetical protein
VRRPPSDIAGPDGTFDSLVPGQELHRFHNERSRERSCYLLGRNPYERLSTGRRPTKTRSSVTLIKAGLVDEFQPFVCPVIVGGGTPFLLVADISPPCQC